MGVAEVEDVKNRFVGLKISKKNEVKLTVSRIFFQGQNKLDLTPLYNSCVGQSTFNFYLLRPGYLFSFRVPLTFPPALHIFLADLRYLN